MQPQKLGRVRRYTDPLGTLLPNGHTIEQRVKPSAKHPTSASMKELLNFIAEEEGTLFNSLEAKMFNKTSRNVGPGEASIRLHYGLSHANESLSGTQEIDIPELDLEVKKEGRIKPGRASQSRWMWCYSELLKEDVEGIASPGESKFLWTNYKKNLTWIEAINNELTLQLLNDLPETISDFIIGMMMPSKILSSYPNIAYVWPEGFIVVPGHDYDRAWRFSGVSQQIPRYVLKREYVELRAKIALNLKERIKMKKVGIVAGSFKPFHAGHMALIELASKENDEVKLFVSLSDRAEPGEVHVKGSTMGMLWREEIENKLPKNVKVEYTPPSSPIGKTYEFLGKENELGSDDRYVIYGVAEDLDRNFLSTSLQKYMDRLYEKGQVVLEPVSRNETVSVSGTDMRKWLHARDESSFISNFPEGMNGKRAWEMLSADGTDVISPKRRGKKIKK